MKNKKVLGLLLSFAMLCSIAIPGVWAVETDTEDAAASDNITASSVQTTESDAAAEEEMTLPEENETAPVQEENAEESTGAEQPATDGAVESEEAGNAEVPQQEKTPAETTTPTETAAPDHIEGCSDECNGQDCSCPCHGQSLFDRLMACNTLDEMYAIADAASEEEILALTDEENAQLEEKVSALEPEAPAEEPEMLDEEAAGEDAPVPSVIIYPTVNFDHVAPLGEPAEG